MHDITSSEEESKKYKQRQKRSNGLTALNYLKAEFGQYTIAGCLFYGHVPAPKRGCH